MLPLPPWRLGGSSSSSSSASGSASGSELLVRVAHTGDSLALGLDLWAFLPRAPGATATVPVALCKKLALLLLLLLLLLPSTVGWLAWPSMGG